MTRAPLVLQAHLWFAREGLSFTQPTNGTVARDALPGPSDTVWAYLGIISELSVEGSADEVEVYRGMPGRNILEDVIPVRAQVRYNFTVREIGPQAIELLFRTGPLTASSTEFTPLAVSGIKGWLKAQWYDHTDAQRIITDNWVILQPAGPLRADGQNLSEVQFQARLLYSTLNKGGI